jgi:hypothetical protein
MSKKTLVMLSLLSLVIAGATAFLFNKNRNTASGEMVKKAITSKKDVVGSMSESERRAYVEKHIKIEDLVIEPDTQIGPEGKTIEIKGLLRVKGTAHNDGDKSVNKAQLVLHIKDDKDDVLGTDIEDVLAGRNLLGGAKQSFSFTIRDRKGFTNRYLLKVR